MSEAEPILQSNGMVLCICGPSGAGKGTLISAIRQSIPNLFLSISQTTRQPRDGEEHGVHYFFCSKPEFEAQIAAGEILEYDEYLDNYYGTPVAPIRQSLSEGKNVVLDITIAGGFRVRELFPEECILVFVVPDTLDTLRERLCQRGTETLDVIERRLQKARAELDNIAEFDYLLINDSLPHSIERLRSIILAESCLPRRQSQVISDLQKDFERLKID